MRIPAALATLLLIAACGGGGSSADDALHDAGKDLTDARSGTFSLTLAGTGGATPVGFSVKGPFEYPEKDAYPLLDVVYTRTRADGSSTNEFRSDGAAAWVIDGAAVTSVGVAQLEGLRQGEGIAGAVPDLDVASWFDGATNHGDVVTGTVDAVALLGDLQRLAAEIDGNQGADTIEGGAAAQLRKAVRSSSIELRTVGAEHRFRSLRLTIDFGTTVPEAVDSALVAYGAPHLELRITCAPLDGPLRVTRPGA